MGERESNIRGALEALSLLPKTQVLRASSLYETEPVGYANQQDFYNALAELESAFTPNEMLGACLGIEAGFGRVRGIKNGPRILDLDVILAQGVSLDEENLILPHPRYTERRFILEPLLELFPQGSAYGVEFLPYIERLTGQDIRKIKDLKETVL